MEDNSTNPEYQLAGELARSAGVSTDTLRHYETKGVLDKPRRSRNGYRLYPSEALARVLLVRRAIRIGFTLDQLAAVFGERAKGGSPCRSVYTLATEKLADVEEELLTITALRDELPLHCLRLGQTPLRYTSRWAEPVA